MSGAGIFSYLIMTLSVGYVFVFPFFNEISLLMEEKGNLKESLSTILDIENKKNELQAKFNEIPEADKINISAALPDSFGFVKLVSEIDAVASRYGISLDNVSAKETGSSSGESIAEAEPEKPFETATLGFSFNASYEQFNGFMNDLEKSLRVLDVKSVKINSVKDGKYSYSVEFETYWLKP